MAQTEASTRRVPDPPVFITGAGRAAIRDLALEYAQAVLHSETAELADHRHALLVVVHELEQTDQAYRNFAGIARARQILDATRAPGPCPGSGKVVPAVSTDGDGVTTCHDCHRPHLTAEVPGFTYRLVEDHTR